MLKLNAGQPPATNAETAKAIIDAQAEKGRRKYGVGLERSHLSVSELARYGAEEAADQLAYFVGLSEKAKAMESRLAVLEAENAVMAAALAEIAHIEETDSGLHRIAKEALDAIDVGGKAVIRMEELEHMASTLHRRNSMHVPTGSGRLEIHFLDDDLAKAAFDAICEEGNLA
jgi:predicted dehydrogenase